MRVALMNEVRRRCWASVEREVESTSPTSIFARLFGLSQAPSRLSSSSHVSQALIAHESAQGTMSTSTSTTHHKVLDSLQLVGSSSIASRADPTFLPPCLHLPSRRPSE